jgi:hypothetical protein
LLNFFNHFCNADGGSVRFFRQFAYFFGYDGKTSAGITGSGSFDGGV